MPRQQKLAATFLFLVVLLSAGPARAEDDAGVTAKDRQFWAFRALLRPAVPSVAARIRTPVDAFLLARLEEKGLCFAADADRYALLRRASFDLTGLPPTTGEIEAFLADRRPDAYERLIDRLLASPHFGERWGRHWLDAAGYVDVMGGDNDAGTVKLGAGKWRYRDYVIRSFNQDKPFNRFLVEQLAGDELVDWRSAPHYPAEMRELLIATGFLRVASDDTDENEINTAGYRYGVLTQTAETLASNLLGVTLHCAKCHDHKFEPIPQRDYYRLTAILSPAFNPQHWPQPKQRQLSDLTPAEKAELNRQMTQVNQELAVWQKPYEEKIFAAKLAKVPAELRGDVQAAVRTAANKRNEVQKYLAGKYEARLKIAPEDALPLLDAPGRKKVQEALAHRAAVSARLRQEVAIQAVYDVTAPTPTYVLRRGDYQRPGKAVPPGFLSVLCRTEAEAVAHVGPPKNRSSGRRLALAGWLTAPGTPAAALVARVQMNRAWQHLFGVGIVATVDNLGTSGMRPTHPELLDWLAGEFIRRGWRLKPMLQSLMLSTAYRQSSTIADAGPSNSQSAIRNPQWADPGNTLLWRMRLRRLESESIRDALLAVSGKLDETMGGPPLLLTSRPDGLVVIEEKSLPAPTRQWRRSVYVLGRRNYHLSMLATFDQPVLTTNCTCRSPSAVVAQSLTMLNDSSVIEHAGYLARQLGGGPSHEQVPRAFLRVFGRPAKPAEVALCTDFLRTQNERFKAAKLPPDEAARQAMTHLCHMLLSTNEFLYVH